MDAEFQPTTCAAAAVIVGIEGWFPTGDSNCYPGSTLTDDEDGEAYTLVRAAFEGTNE